MTVHRLRVRMEVPVLMASIILLVIVPQVLPEKHAKLVSEISLLLSTVNRKNCIFILWWKYLFLVVVLAQNLLEKRAKIVSDITVFLSLWNRSNCTFILSDCILKSFYLYTRVYVFNFQFKKSKKKNLLSKVTYVHRETVF